MKKRFIYLVLLFIIYKPLDAQVYTAGTIYPYYFDITPDSLLRYWVGTSHINDESYYIDVNGDLSYDLRLRAYAQSGVYFGAGSITVSSLSANTFIRFSRIDTATNLKVALPLNNGDSINSKISIWDSLGLYITYDNLPYMAPSKAIKLDWCTNSDLYLGIKYASSIDTIYGWIRLNCSSGWYAADCLVKDYSFQSIYAGIEEYNSKKIKFFPNPVSNILKIENEKNNFQNSEIEIANYLGQTILKTEFKNQIDVSELTSGFYTLLIKDNSGSVITKKFVKE